MKSKNTSYSRRQVLKTGLLAGGSLMTAKALSAADKSNPQSAAVLEDQVAFVTGAARGIGRATALKLAEMGAKVAICDIAAQIDTVEYPMATSEDLSETQRMVTEKGVDCLAFEADVREVETIKAVVQKIVQDWGRIDILVNNAGIATISPVETVDWQAWEDTLAVNLKGPAICIQAVIPHMRAQKYGRIVNISSVNGRNASPGAPAYSASKWGLLGLTKSVARELGNDNITSNAICPTGIDTGMLNNAYMHKLWNPTDPTEKAMQTAMQEEHTLPVGLLDPMAIADSVAYFCSPQATYVTGVILDVAAGLTAKNSA